MSWISTPELVGAVSNAGGVGILATGPLNPQETRDAIHKIRRIAPNKPFGIGATLLMPGSTENAKVALDEKVPIINVSLGKPDWIVDAAHNYGGKVLCTVINSDHARSAVKYGVDALMVTGHEGAAHTGDVTSLVLVPSIASKFPNIPIVAAGGFATGGGLSAALALGADAVAMGTRFAVTTESPLALKTKYAIANPDEDGGSTERDTIYGSNFDGIPARVYKNRAAIKANEKPAPFHLVLYRAFAAARDMDLPLWKVIPGLISQWNKMYTIAQFGSAATALKAATVHGDLENEGVQFIGQCQGLVNDIPSVETLVQRIIHDAEKTSMMNAERFGINEETFQNQESYYS